MGYIITDENGGTMQVEGVWLAPHSETEQALCDAENVLDKVLLYTCSVDILEARSEAGSDRKEISDERYISLSPESIVWEDGRAAGILYRNHLFLFDKCSTHTYRHYSYDGPCGGGERSVYDEYRLIQKKGDECAGSLQDRYC